MSLLTKKILKITLIAVTVGVFASCGIKPEFAKYDTQASSSNTSLLNLNTAAENCDSCECLDGVVTALENLVDPAYAPYGGYCGYNPYGGYDNPYGGYGGYGYPYGGYGGYGYPYSGYGGYADPLQQLKTSLLGLDRNLV